MTPECPHCDTPITEHEASRCLDAWVHHVVMELDVPENPNGFGECLTCRSTQAGAALPAYSENIAAAWRVVQEMMHEGDVFIEWWQDDEWCLFTMPLLSSIWPASGRPGACAPTAPLAICRAAILALDTGAGSE